MLQNHLTNPYKAIDAHLDIGMYLRMERSKGRHKVIASDYMQQWHQGNIRVIVAAIYVDENSENGSSLRQACEQIAALQAEQRESPECIELVRDYQGILDANAAGKVAILLSFEGAEPLGASSELLPFFYNAGVVGLGLAHARRNLACDGARYTSNPHNIGCGLTELGVELVEQAEALHMLIDIVHLNDAGMQDVFSVTRGPLICSHGNARALNPTLRNLSDEQIRTIAERGGVIGINGCSALVSDIPGKASVDEMILHMDHIIRVGGSEVLGLGFDIAEMIMPGGLIRVNGNDVAVRDMVPTHAHLGSLAERLEQHGYSAAAIEKIFYKNWMRVYRDILR